MYSRNSTYKYRISKLPGLSFQISEMLTALEYKKNFKKYIDLTSYVVFTI